MLQHRWRKRFAASGIEDERSAKTYLLAHLLVILLLEPLTGEFEASPSLAQAA
jgi:hypothetical protein